MQDALTTFFSQFEPVPWLCYLFPVLALGILIRCAVSLLTFRPEPEVWAWLTTPDGAHIPVTHWESLIGRGAGCDVQLGYPTVSRTHAVLTRYDDGSWTISDAHSKSGVFVNGKQTALSALRFGDVITMGGINFTLIPLTKEQERIQAGTRTRAGHAVHQVPTLLLLTLFQLLTAIQLILGGCDPALELTAFGGLIGLEWALYLALRAFRRTGFEAETLAFFLCTMGLAVVSSSAPESLIKELLAIVAGVCVFLVVCWSLRDLERAKKIAAEITNSSMSKSQKLQTCFNWVIKGYYNIWRDFDQGGKDWPATFANDHFLHHNGDCVSDAGAFAYLAKAIGYKNVYVCADAVQSNNNAHAWCEINGYVYDPLFAEAKSYSKYYGATYGSYGLYPVLKYKIS